jgi:hypothetical protein
MGWVITESGFNSWLGQEIILSFIMSISALGPIQPPIEWGEGVLFLQGRVDRA